MSDTTLECLNARPTHITFVALMRRNIRLTYRACRHDEVLTLPQKNKKTGLPIKSNPVNSFADLTSPMWRGLAPKLEARTPLPDPAYRLRRSHARFDGKNFHTTCKRCGTPLTRTMAGWEPDDPPLLAES